MVNLLKQIANENQENQMGKSPSLFHLRANFAQNKLVDVKYLTLVSVNN